MSKRTLQILQFKKTPVFASVHTENTESFSGFNEFAAICFVVEGNMRLSNDTESYNVNEGEFYFLGKYANYKIDRKVGKTGMFHLQSIICDDITSQQRIGVFSKINTFQKLGELFKLLQFRLKNELPLSKDDYNNIGIRSKKIAQQVPVNETDNGFLKFLFDNITTNITLDNLAKKYGKSTTAFKILFKEHIGMSPHKWFKEQRLHFAKIRMQHTQKPVSQLYLDLGFEDLSHFSKSFKKHFGYNPSEEYGKVVTKIIE